jgi:hypothetical protein
MCWKTVSRRETARVYQLRGDSSCVMRLRHLLTRWVCISETTSTQAVLICVDISQCRNAGIVSAELEQFVAIVRKFMPVRQLDEYAGYECLQEETRNHLFSWGAPALAASIRSVLRALRVYGCTTIGTSENVLGGGW